MWCTVQDACCETPSDYLDAGQSDLYVPTVPHGFIREVVIDEQSHARAVYYHHFAGGPVGSRAVRETALLRTVMSKEGGVDDTETVDGFLRRHPHVQGLRITDFNFRTEAAPSKASAPGQAAAKAAKAAEAEGAGGRKAEAEAAEKAAAPAKRWHPVYKVMVKAALVGLKKPKGSPLWAVVKYIMANYNLPSGHFVSKASLTALKKMKDAGEVTEDKAKFKLSAQAKKAAPKATVAPFKAFKAKVEGVCHRRPPPLRRSICVEPS